MPGELARAGPRIARLIPLLGSPEHGEVLGAAAAIGRVLRAHGLDWHALASAVDDQHEAADRDRHAHDYAFAAELRQHAARLTEWEARFLTGIAIYEANCWPLSERQVRTIAS